MVARRIFIEPTSKLAIWSLRLAFFAIPVALLAIIVTRADYVEVFPAVATFGGALAIAAAGVLLALAAMIAIWNRGLGGFGRAALAMLIGVAMFAYPAYLTYRWNKYPPLVDITTDPIDPPRFEAVARLRSRDANSVIYPGLYAAEVQRTAYPEVEPLMVSVNPQRAYDVALAIVNKHRWVVVDARAPQAGRRDGRIEAVARTAVMGFRDDVVIRFRPTEDGTRIDIRSASRYGWRDFGDNAARVRTLSEEIDDQATDVPDKPVSAAKKAGQRPAKR